MFSPSRSFVATGLVSLWAEESAQTLGCAGMSVGSKNGLLQYVKNTHAGDLDMCVCSRNLSRWVCFGLFGWLDDWLFGWFSWLVGWFVCLIGLSGRSVG